jgi:hypothetical protein
MHDKTLESQTAAQMIDGDNDSNLSNASLKNNTVIMTERTEFNNEIPTVAFQNQQPDKQQTLQDLLLCFSIHKNFNDLMSTRLKPGDNPELLAFEGMRVLSMMYGIFCCTALYVLLPMLTNIEFMLHLFENIGFTVASSGNLSGTGFLFAAGFLAFVRMGKYYDEHNGIGAKEYFRMVWYTYWKLAPLMMIYLFFGWFILPLLGAGP